MVLLSGLAGKLLPYGLAAALILGGVLWYWHLTGELAAAKAAVAAEARNLALVQSANDGLTKALAVAKRQAAANEAALATAQSLATARQSRVDALDAAIMSQSAVPGDDGPVAPVLANALAGLRQAGQGAAP